MTRKRKPTAGTARGLPAGADKIRLRSRDLERVQNKLAQPQNRWQRFVRYVWDKRR
jgi:hypothetical protein